MDSKNTPAELSDYPVVISVPIQWGDQDAFGHVNNAVVIRWFESSRIAYCESTGLMKALNDKNLGPILASITCHYRQQLRHPDTVYIGGRISKIGNSSLRMEHAVYSESQQRLAAEGDSIVVAFNYQSNQVQRVPDSARAIIQEVEGESPLT